MHNSRLVNKGEFDQQSVEWSISFDDVPSAKDKPDLIDDSLIILFPKNPTVGQQTLIKAGFKNIGTAPANNVKTRIHDGERNVNGPDVDIGVGETSFVVFSTTFTAVAIHTITAEIDYDSAIDELDETNNDKSIYQSVT